jgi:hypothetical protein
MNSGFELRSVFTGFQIPSTGVWRLHGLEVDRNAGRSLDVLHSCQPSPSPQKSPAGRSDELIAG